MTEMTESEKNGAAYLFGVFFVFVGLPLLALFLKLIEETFREIRKLLAQ